MLSKLFSNQNLLRVLLAAVFAVCMQSAAQAQDVDLRAESKVMEERHRVSGWEEPLCKKDGNLRNYYWTDIDVSSRYRTNAISRVANSKHPYHVINRVASSKPVCIQPMSARARGLGGDNRIATSDVSGSVHSRNGAGSRASSSAGTFTYASYNYNPSSKPYTQYESSRNVKGRVLTY